MCHCIYCFIGANDTNKFKCSVYDFNFDANRYRALNGGASVLSYCLIFEVSDLYAFEPYPNM